MSQRKTIRRQLPLDLFRERLTTPDWHQLPDEVRRRARPLLARLLRSHRHARPGAAHDQGVRHE
jgi:hypothetical protein